MGRAAAQPYQAGAVAAPQARRRPPPPACPPAPPPRVPAPRRVNTTAPMPLLGASIGRPRVRRPDASPPARRPLPCASEPHPHSMRNSPGVVCTRCLCAARSCARVLVARARRLLSPPPPSAADRPPGGGLRTIAPRACICKSVANCRVCAELALAAAGGSTWECQASSQPARGAVACATALKRPSTMTRMPYP